MENVGVTSIALWNAGSQFIDSNDFVAPISIETTKPITFLYAEQHRASRQSLSIRIAEPQPASGTMSGKRISISVPVGEALEHNDGTVIKVVFSGPPDARFSVQGRIKGVPEGFHQLDLQSLHPVARWIAAGISLLFAAVALIGLFQILQSIKEKGVGLWLVKESTALAVVALLIGVLTYRFREPAAPAWVGTKTVKQDSRY